MRLLLFTCVWPAVVPVGVHYKEADYRVYVDEVLTSLTTSVAGCPEACLRAHSFSLGDFRQCHDALATRLSSDTFCYLRGRLALETETALARICFQQADRGVWFRAAGFWEGVPVWFAPPHVESVGPVRLVFSERVSGTPCNAVVWGVDTANSANDETCKLMEVSKNPFYFYPIPDGSSALLVLPAPADRWTLVLAALEQMCGGQLLGTDFSLHTVWWRWNLTETAALPDPTEVLPETAQAVRLTVCLAALLLALC
eukprot:Gregarina_sp_Pseudo_9__152@NODE_1102_length_1876_cov_91_081655_g1030_i0_p1_GENE_NODE_1102_length_1876_cov_91_081655_g1030_i0NODE_1102_length_1876_cov_91_081655_g1030_i0_p1_ORF_typecomplete_len264_score89_66_NODE_1102_length_1876_cov_91_081655_g1030_i026793